MRDIQQEQSQGASPTQGPGRGTEERGGGHRAALRGMSYDEGAAALAPVQLKADAGAKPKGPPRQAPVLYVKHDEAAYGGKGVWEVTIQRGAKHGVAPGQQVRYGGVEGIVAAAWPVRAKCAFRHEPEGEDKLVYFVDAARDAESDKEHEAEREREYDDRAGKGR